MAESPPGICGETLILGSSSPAASTPQDFLDLPCTGTIAFSPAEPYVSRLSSGLSVKSESTPQWLRSAAANVLSRGENHEISNAADRTAPLLSCSSKVTGLAGQGAVDAAARGGVSQAAAEPEEEEVNWRGGVSMAQ